MMIYLDFNLRKFFIFIFGGTIKIRLESILSFSDYLTMKISIHPNL